MCSGSEAGLYLRLIDFAYPSLLESNKEEEQGVGSHGGGHVLVPLPPLVPAKGVGAWSDAEAPLIVIRGKVQGRCKATWKREFKLPGARPVHLIITIIKWIRTSRLSILSVGFGMSRWEA